jgi:hypothetical protein
MDYWAQLRKFRKALDMDTTNLITSELLEEMKGGKELICGPWEARLKKDTSKKENERFQKMIEKRYGISSASSKQPEPFVIPRTPRGWRVPTGRSRIPFHSNMKLEGIKGYTLYFDMPLTPKEEERHKEKLDAFFSRL